jgi:hypothetical protein
VSLAVAHIFRVAGSETIWQRFLTVAQVAKFMNLIISDGALGTHLCQVIFLSFVNSAQHYEMEFQRQNSIQSSESK